MFAFSQWTRSVGPLYLLSFHISPFILCYENSEYLLRSASFASKLLFDYLMPSLGCFNSQAFETHSNSQVSSTSPIIDALYTLASA